MIVDRYTKVVLTVIAGSLLWLCAMTAGRPAQAQQLGSGSLPGGAVPIMIVGWGNVAADGTIAVHYAPNGPHVTDPTLPVRTTTTVAATLPYSDANPLPVKVGSAPEHPIAVWMSAVRPAANAPWEPMRVQVENEPPRKKPGGDQ